MLKQTVTALLLSLSVISYAKVITKTELHSQEDLKADNFITDRHSGIDVKKISGNQNFTFINQSSLPVCRLNISPNYPRFWEENVIKKKVYTGAPVEVNVTGYDTQCAFDVRLVTCSGEKVEKRINLCTAETLTLY